MQKLLGEVYYYINNVCLIDKITEIRIRINQKIIIKTKDSSIYLPFVATKKFIDDVVDRATNFSRYAYQGNISKGYIDYEGGVRIGLTGEGWNNGRDNVFREIYSLCIRIPHEIKSINIPDEIIKKENILIISPPGGGKTTLLREISRRLGERYDLLIIDEREEICGKRLQFDPSSRCDVVQGIPKDVVFENIIRSMSPQIVACDELFGEKDYTSVKEIIRSGVNVIATVHGNNHIPDVLNGIFNTKIYLSSIPHPGIIKSIVCNNNEKG